MIGLLKRAAQWWWRELRKPWAVEHREPMGWDDSSEPLDIPAFTKHPPIKHDVKITAVTDRDAMTAEEKALWEDIEGGPPKHAPIVYPPVREQSTRDWVTERLQELTGGLTRHPYDLTKYPEPPTEADLAAREYVQQFGGPRALFSHGYSMQYLSALLRRADNRDRSLTAEELMGLRSRGLA